MNFGEINGSKLDLDALSQATDTSWGRSSTPRTTQNSVKFVIQGNQLVVSFVSIVQFANERQMIETKRLYDDESTRIINANIAATKKRYKEICGKTLKTAEIGTKESVEIINMNFFNPSKKAYYRRKTIFEVS